MNYLRETFRAIRQKGLKTTLFMAWHHLRRKTVAYADLGFDLRYGVDTCALKSIHDLDVDEALKPSLVGYEASPVRVIRAMLQSLPIQYSDFTLIDYGSGKGRVLLLASEHSFKNIVGLELSGALHEIAGCNIAQWSSPHQKCHAIESLNINAVDYKLPTGPLVLFFFTPFLEPVLAKVVSRIDTYMKQSTQDLYIIYYGSRPELMDQFRQLDVDYKEIYSNETLFASGLYRGHLFYRTNRSQE